MVPVPEDTFWWRLTHLEPAMYRGLVVAVVGLLASVGVVVSSAIPDQVVGLIVIIMVFVQALWTRQGVTPNTKVVAYLSDPLDPASITSGSVATTASDSAILNAAKSTGGTS